MVHDILRYIRDQQYPKSATDNDRKTLKRLAIEFFLDEDVLYKKEKDQILLRCVDIDEAKKIVMRFTKVFVVHTLVGM